MASGKEHEKSIKRWAIPIGALLGIILGPQSGLIAGITFLLGGIWLSPDLDTKSLCFKRWSILRCLWLPYQRFFKHRSIFSHGPIVGTFIRLIYMAIIILIILTSLDLAGKVSLKDIFEVSLQLFFKNKRIALSALIGLEASVWLHIILDGDPLPVEWKSKKHF